VNDKVIGLMLGMAIAFTIILWINPNGLTYEQKMFNLIDLRSPVPPEELERFDNMRGTLHYDEYTHEGDTKPIRRRLQFVDENMEDIFVLIQTIPKDEACK